MHHDRFLANITIYAESIRSNDRLKFRKQEVSVVTFSTEKLITGLEVLLRLALTHSFGLDATTLLDARNADVVITLVLSAVPVPINCLEGGLMCVVKTAHEVLSFANATVCTNSSDRLVLIKQSVTFRAINAG